MRPKFLRTGAQTGLDWGQLALLVWTAVLLAVCIRSAIQPRSRSLFYTYAGAGADWIDGNNLYFHAEWPSYLDQYRYSPLVAVLLTPLSLLNERVGNVLWRLFNAGVLLGGLWWWLKSVLPDAHTHSLKAIMALLVTPLALASLNNGQTNPLVIGFLLMATAALNGGRWNLAAWFITAACALKLYPIAVGLLLLLVYPKQLSWRLTLALLAAALLPFCCQGPAYVAEQYRQWWQLLGGDDRKNYPLHIAYRDLWLLFRVAQVPISGSAYLVIQLVLATFCALLGFLMRWAEIGKSRQLTSALMLGCCWMTLCGPATESSSFVQIAPALAWAMIAARREPWPLLLRWLPLAGFVCLMSGVLAGATPWTGRLHGFGIQPLGTLLLFVAYLGIAIQTLFAHKSAVEAQDGNVAARAA